MKKKTDYPVLSFIISEKDEEEINKYINKNTNKLKEICCDIIKKTKPSNIFIERAVIDDIALKHTFMAMR